MDKMQIINVKPAAVQPLHQPCDEDKLARITQSMRQHGWIGRPILAWDCADHYEAITGSHRLIAAKAAELETIPVVAIMDADASLVDDWQYATHDDDRLALLEQHGYDEAARLMRAEVESNYGSEIARILGRKGGQSRSKRKQAASRENGRKGGRKAKSK